MAVDLAGDVGVGPIPDDVASTAFFVASGAMVNAVKHAHPQAIGVRVTRTDGSLTVQVCATAGAVPTFELVRGWPGSPMGSRQWAERCALCQPGRRGNDGAEEATLPCGS